MGIHDRDYYQDRYEMQPHQAWNGRSMVSQLIIVNVVIFLINFVMGSATKDPINQYLWLHAADLKQPIYWFHFLTNGFAHSKDITHILFNMLTLYLLGQSVESRYGRWEFLRIYLLVIAISSLGWAARTAFTCPPELLHLRGLLGASGAVTAVAMLFVFNYPNATLMAFGVFPIKAWVYGVLVVVTNTFGTSRFHFANIEGDQIAYDVHLIGAGLAAIYFYSGMSLAWMGGLRGLVGSMKKRPKLKIHAPSDKNDGISEKLKVEADRILEKISREGQTTLTPSERKLLEEYSRAVRKSRQH